MHEREMPGPGSPGTLAAAACLVRTNVRWYVGAS